MLLAHLKTSPNATLVIAVKGIQLRTFGTAVGEQGQSTHDSVQLTLHLKYQIKPIQLRTHQVNRFCIPLFQSRSSEENCNKFPLGTICDAQLVLGLVLKCHKSFPLPHFISSTPISGSTKPPREILVLQHPRRKCGALFTIHYFFVSLCSSLFESKSTFVQMWLHIKYMCAHSCKCWNYYYHYFYSI